MAHSVLFIDPDDGTRNGLVSLLEASGYEVLQTGDAERGLQLADSQDLDLVMCDAAISVEGGNLCAMLAERLADVPVITLSREETFDGARVALKSGAADYVIKPVRDAGLFNFTVAKVLESAETRRDNLHYRRELKVVNDKLVNNLKQLQQDQRAGRYVQRGMLPESPQTIGSVSVEHSITPSLYMSGDFVDYFAVDDDLVVFYLADVSGHGSSSAFVTVLLKSLSRRIARYFHALNFESPADILAWANIELMENDLDKHVTMFLGMVRGNTLTYANAAHFPVPILCSGDTCAYLESGGLPLGLFDDAEFESWEISLDSNWSLHAFSDGVLELMTEPDLNAKEARILGMVRDGKRSVATLSEALALEELEHLPDDVSLLTVREAGDGSGEDPLG